MTDTRELIERLRKHPVITMDKQNVTSEAADLIEQQAREIRRLGYALDFHTDDIVPKLKARIAEVEGENIELKCEWMKALRKLKALQEPKS